MIRIIKRSALTFVIGVCGIAFAFSQRSQAERDSLARLSAMDHAQMKAQLGLLVPNRPGPSGNPQAPNAANADESMVRDYVLPDPLQMEDGRKVTSAALWQKERRPELSELFERELFGRIPRQVPAVNWEVVSELDTMAGIHPMRQIRLNGRVDNSSYPDIEVNMEMEVYLPANADGPVPLVLEFGFLRWPFGPRPAETPTTILSRGEPTGKEQLISRGWGFAILVPGSIQADNGAGLRQGIIGLVNKGQARSPDDWGSLRAWGWGASRALDYFETHPGVDATRVAIEGLSRYGKAALVAMAFDERFSIGFIGSSGAGGAKILRRNFGEQVENLAGTGEYHWFSGNFIRYASELTVDDLPVDAHQLVALCAPRPVFISAGSPDLEGHWIDAVGMFEAGVHAGPVYSLLDAKPMNTDDFPPLGTALTSGELAFRQHAGGHSTGPNWSTFIGWACRYWGDCSY